MKMSYDLDLDFDNICRICLTQQEKFVSLFTNQIVDGYIRTMPFIVSYCLDVTIDEKDALPKKVCETCKTTVINYFTFKERCKRTEKVLLETIHKAKQIMGVIVKDEVEPYVIETSPFVITADEEAKPPASDLVATIALEQEPENEMMDEHEDHDATDFSKQLEEVSRFDDHAELVDAGEVDDLAEVGDDLMDGEESQKSAEYVVGDSKEIVCKKEFAYLVGSNENVPLEEEHLLTTTVDDEFNASVMDDFFCELCQKEFPKSEYVVHSSSAHFLCTTCMGTYETEDNLNEHIKEEHKPLLIVQTTGGKKINNNSLLCQLCNKRWGTIEQLNQHMRLHEALNISMESKYDCHECPQCHTVYLKAEDLENHMSLHIGAKSLHADDAICTDYQFLEEEKPMFFFICGLCKSSYATMDEMRCHIIIHFDSFSCPFDSCGCEYDTFSRLSLHIVKKHVYGEEHFCTHCRKERFATFDELQLHIRNDCSAKKFPCHHCDKKFFSKKALQLHIKHTGDKKYNCKQCSKSFAQRGELNIHMRTHTGERPFKCTICSKTYRTASMRTAHMDAHIDGKTFQCTVCGKMLQSRTSYRNHMKRHTLGKSYKCRDCTKCFYTKYHLDLHMLKIHNKAKGS